MKILHLISSVDPRGGGPIEGVRRLMDALADLGHDSELASVDDPTSAPELRFFARERALGPARGRYGYSPRLLPWLQANAERYDAVIVNGLWQHLGLATRQALAGRRTPYFVFTHGMLDPWFKHQYPAKHLKKWLYWPWGEYRVLRDARAVLFTCDEERLLARQSFWLYRAREAVVSYGTASPPDNAVQARSAFIRTFPDLANKRLLLFLGRLHEKKGCDLLIDAFAQVCTQAPELQLVMAGPDSQGWQNTLQAMAERRGVADRITWTGMLTGELKWGAFHASEAFCLPSHQENFGIAVTEAMACRLPVLISNKVNIWREIQADGAGVVENDDLAGTVRALQRWLAMNAEDRRHMQDAALASFDRRFRIEQVAHNLIRLLSAGPAVPATSQASYLAEPRT